LGNCDIVVAESGRLIARFGFEQGRFGGDFHLFGGRAAVELSVNAQDADVQCDAVADQVSKTFLRESKFVLSWNDRDGIINAGLICGEFGGHTGLDVKNRDPDPRYHRP
jgi:hypothetical protein